MPSRSTANTCIWAYPILKESSLFYLDNLVEEPKHRWLVTGPSNPPENCFKLPNGNFGTSASVRRLTCNCSANCSATPSTCGNPRPGRRSVPGIQRKACPAVPNQVGPDGRLQEWLDAYPEPEPTHRHTSHMYGLHPYNEITLRGTPESAAACRKSLDAGGDQSNGGRLRVNFWARSATETAGRRLLQALLFLTGERTLNYTGQGAGAYAVSSTPARHSRSTVTSAAAWHRRDAVAEPCWRDRLATRPAQGVAEWFCERVAGSRWLGGRPDLERRPDL